MKEPTTWHPVVFPEASMTQMAEGLKGQPAEDYRDHAITEAVLKHLGPQRTVVDIGAGIGRFTVPVAEANCEVWAVEPSAIMREQLTAAVKASPSAARVHTVAGLWPRVEVPRVEVALAALVIHFSPTPRAFIQAMERTATRRCVVVIHVEPMLADLQDWWPLFHPDRPAPIAPAFRDVYTLLWEEGIVADVAIIEPPARGDFWRDPDKMLDGFATLLDLSTETERARLASLLQERLTAPGASVTRSRHRLAVVSWSPDSP